MAWATAALAPPTAPCPRTAACPHGRRRGLARAGGDATLVDAQMSVGDICDTSSAPETQRPGQHGLVQGSLLCLDSSKKETSQLLRVLKAHLDALRSVSDCVRGSEDQPPSPTHRTH